MEAIPAYLTGLIAVLMLTSFVKVFTSLNLLRYGIGLGGGGFGVVILGLSLALTFLIMTPQLKSSGGLGGLLSSQTSEATLEKNFSPFLEKHETMHKLMQNATKRRSESWQRERSLSSASLVLTRLRTDKPCLTR